MNIKFACWSIAAGLAFVSATCVAAGKGEMWEITTKMEMEGMPAMPMPASKVCIPKGQEKDPNRAVPEDKNCKTSDVKVSGNKMSWKMKCEGKDAMSGSGEMIFGDGTYSGKMKMHDKDGDMVVAYNGKRVGGACEVGEEKKRFEEKAQAMKKEMRDEMRAECKEHLDKGGTILIDNYSAFTMNPPIAMQSTMGLSPVCADMKKSMCDKVRAQSSEYNVYEALVEQEKVPAATRSNQMKELGLTQVLRPLSVECGFNMAKMTGGVCQRAIGDKKYDFLVATCPREARSGEVCQMAKGDEHYGYMAAHCPVEAQALAKQHCESWGRDYSADYRDNEYALICAKYSKNKIRYKVADKKVDDSSADAAGGKEGVIGKLFGGKSEESASADEQKPQGSKTGEKADNPAGAVLDGAKKLKGLFGF